MAPACVMYHSPQFFGGTWCYLVFVVVEKMSLVRHFLRWSADCSVVMDVGKSLSIFFWGTISIPSIEFENVRGTPIQKLWFMWDVGKEEMRCLMFSYMDFPQLTMTLPDMM